MLQGVAVRRSLDLTNWEAANRKIRELEIHGDAKVFSVKEAIDKFLADREADRLGYAPGIESAHAYQIYPQSEPTCILGSFAGSDGVISITAV